MAARIEPPTHWNTEGVFGWARERAGAKERGGRCLIHGTPCRYVYTNLSRNGVKMYSETWQCDRCRKAVES